MELAPGSRLGPYEILSPLGAGGMGEVYRAKDPRLGREVAIKVLPASLSSDLDRLRRFEQEARSAGVLNHPNVTAVYDVGEHDGAPYVVQELLEGETLSARLAGGALPVQTAIDYAVQIAQGLAAAQEKGIVHRDLKPDNLFLTREGRVKILDFGLAKLTQRSDPEPRTEAPTAAGTEAGMVLGTLGYMSPEQLRGQPADARSDIFAFGAVLYEMLSGRRAFRRGSAAETMSAILTAEPPDLSTTNPSVSPGLERLVLHCLEKAPERRFQSATDVVFALQAEARAIEGPFSARASPRPRRRFAPGALLLAAAAVAALVAVRALRARSGSAAGSAPVRSIAVLPLTSFSTDPEQEFFADSMTDAVITDLARIGELRVVSRTSVMRYKRTQKSIPEIARELGVDAVVEGSVERSQNRVRITAQLIRAATDQHLWADSYERDLKDVLMLQDQVALSIAKEIQVKLTPLDKERLKAPRVVDPTAYELLLKGRYFWGKRTPESIQKAIGLFGQAIEADPTYASAYAALAACYMSLGFSFDVGSLPPNEAIPKAKAAAEKAIEIDDSLAEAHNPLAFIKLNYDWDFAGSEREFKRALDQNPGYADAHHWYAHLLIATGRPEESLAESNRALELDPLSTIMSAHLGWLYYYLRRNGLALTQLGKTLELDPNYGLAHWYIGLVKEQQGRYPEALDEMRRAVELLKGNLVVEADRAHLLAVSKRTAEAQEALRGLLAQSRTRYVNPVEIALVQIGLGRNDEAFRWLDRAFEERSDLLVYLRVDPRLDPIRSDPRFAGLLRRVGLSG